MVQPRRACLPLLLALLVAFAAPSARAADDAVYNAAYGLLQKTVNGDGGDAQHVMLRGLRSIGDPQLKPIFEKLTQSPSPLARIHGFLGLAELDPKKHLDLKRLVTISEAKTPEAKEQAGAIQSQVIMAALDSDLLDAEQSAQILTWKDLDPAVRVIVATVLVRDKKLPADQTPLLRQAAEPSPTTQPNVTGAARRGLAALLLVQLGDPAGEQTLQTLDRSSDVRRDDTRELILQSAMRFEFDKIAPWAQRLAGDSATSPQLAIVALKVALRFAAPGATDLWLKQFRGTKDIAQKTRLALIAVNLSTWIDPSLPREMTASDDPFIKQAGVAGAAIRAKNGVADAIIALVALQHPLGTHWALEYAKTKATPDDARAIYVAVIKSLDGPARGEAQRMDDVIVATQQIFDLDAAKAIPLLRPLIAPSTTDDDQTRARLMLLGLLSAKGDGYAVLDGQPGYQIIDIDNLELLLLARSNRPMNDAQMKDLGLMVRGGGVRGETVRLQAAWAWLRRTNQTKDVIAKLVQ